MVVQINICPRRIVVENQGRNANPSPAARLCAGGGCRGEGRLAESTSKCGFKVDDSAAQSVNASLSRRVASS
jgi:hypothetical protein